jgi:hypothetical protein
MYTINGGVLASACICSCLVQPEHSSIEAIIRILPIAVGGMMISSTAWGLMRLKLNEWRYKIN